MTMELNALMSNCPECWINFLNAEISPRSGAEYITKVLQENYNAEFVYNGPWNNSFVKFNSPYDMVLFKLKWE